MWSEKLREAASLGKRQQLSGMVMLVNRSNKLVHSTAYSNGGMWSMCVQDRRDAIRWGFNAS